LGTVAAIIKITDEKSKSTHSTSCINQISSTIATNEPIKHTHATVNWPQTGQNFSAYFYCHNLFVYYCNRSVTVIFTNSAMTTRTINKLLNWW